MYLAAAVVSERSAVIDQSLYWAAAENLEEARYFTGVLNSGSVLTAIRPLQSRGQHNPRDFHKTVLQLPIPPYDPESAQHARLVELACKAERIAAAVDLRTTRFEAQRRQIRAALAEVGVSAEMDTIVTTLLE